MQDMSSAICSNSNINDTKQLVDRRDGKKYWVAKLTDNNCWMTQNLDLDLTTSGLTADLSDITTDWTSSTNNTYPPVTTQTGSPSGFNNTSNATQGYNVIASFDPGTKICAGYQKGCVEAAGSYDEHYLQGNLYTFNAATAGQGYTKNSGNIENSSICPKNWQLPLSGTSNDTVSKSFYYLLNSYGLTSKTPGAEVNGITYDISLSPIYFVYGGWVNSSSLQYAGSYGYYWSSTASSSTGAYILDFNTSVDPSISWYRYLGMSVRCVAR